MNTLSWLIIFGGFVDRLSGSIVVLLILTGVATIVSTVACSVGKSTDKDDYKKGRYPYHGPDNVAKEFYLEQDSTLYAPWRKRNKFGAILFFVFLIIFVITPSKKDITLVAASEIGERVIKSDTVNKLIDPSVEYLNEWIKSELSALKQNGNNNNGKK